MNFISPDFLIFFPVVYGIYLALAKRHRAQNLLLLGTSYFFYAWFDWRFCGLLLVSTLLDFYIALVMYNVDRTAVGRNAAATVDLRKISLLISLATQLGILATFKYYDFFVLSARTALHGVGLDLPLPLLQAVLPAGISFYTFQTLSYVIDVYDRKIAPTTSLVNFGAYVAYFPHLVAGPIQRAKQLLVKIEEPRHLTAETILSGFYLALYGYVVKVVLADNMAIIVDEHFRNVRATGADIVLGTYAFAFQIYGDFLGYTSIARGISRMMGIEMTLNFRLPYFAIDPSDFWRRWHIALSTWLRDYLYIRLGGNRLGTARTYVNLMIAMALGGLWHGAGGNFVLWGVYHGLLLCLFLPWRRGKPREEGLQHAASGFYLWLRVILYFQLTCFGWLIFRAHGIHDVYDKLGLVLLHTRLADFDMASAARVCAYALPFMAFELYQYRTDRLEPWAAWSAPARVGWVALILVIISVLKPPYQSPFIYFQF
ncbi:MAG TPA: MBOAT family O-acyltransferase [Alphaproteobacteria bacterium]|nr:MBOAT family O-acyltransferase [Alphaproteobacteria bacterium]